MNNKIRTDGHALLLQNLLKNNYIVRNINFEYDIDKKLSERCVYNISSNGHLNFFYEITEEITKDDCKLIAENIIETEESGLLPKNTPFKTAEQGEGYSHYLVNHEINSCNLICINQLEHEISYYLMLGSKKYKEKLQQVYEKIAKNEEKIVDNYGVDGYVFYTWNNGCWINKYNNNIIEKKHEEMHFNKPIIQESINIKKNQVIMWDNKCKKHIKYIKNLNSFEKKYLLLSIKAADINRVGFDSFIKNFTFGKNDGYIYLKTIQIKEKKVQAIMIYSGNPILQYFNIQKCNWESVIEGQKLCIDGNVKLRVKMSSGDSIQDILFVTPKEQVYKEYELLKEIDFYNDLDIGISDKFCIHETKSYLEFLYGISEKVELDQLVPIANVEIDKDKVIFTPISTNKDKWIKDRGIADCLLDETIEPGERELLIINFSKEKSVNFFIEFLYDSSYHKALNVLNGNGFVNEIVRSNGSHTLLHSFRKDIFQIYIAKGFDSETLVKYNLEEIENISYIINFKEGYIQLNKFEKQIARIYHKKLIPKEDLYLYASCIDFENYTTPRRKAEIADIIYGSHNGFVYFKPVSIVSDKFIVKINSIGHPILQYYLYEKEEWIDIQNKIEIKNIKELKMRAKMNIDDLIYNILILDNKK